MDQSQVAEVVERYLKGEMDSQEKQAFEEARKNNPELDQAVVEYHFFFEEMVRYGEVRRFKSNLYDTHILYKRTVKSKNCNSLQAHAL